MVVNRKIVKNARNARLIVTKQLFVYLLDVD